jgi:predicted transcriptional regulator
MTKAIFISIKPEFTKRIELGEKNYEFRKYIPKEKIDKLYVYETVPTCSLKYILTIDKIIEYPNKIIEVGYGNDDFNNGLKKSKYAYHISKVEKLDKSINLKELKNDYSFVPPQSYAYDSRYPELTNYIENTSKTVLVNNEI